MPDARKLDDAVAAPLIPASLVSASVTKLPVTFDGGNFGSFDGVSPTFDETTKSVYGITASGNWVDCSNYVGDLLMLVNLGAVSGGPGSISVQFKSANSAAGSSAVIEATDPRNAGLATLTSSGVVAVPYRANCISNKYAGASCTLSGVSSAVLSVDLIGRPKIR